MQRVLLLIAVVMVIQSEARAGGTEPSASIDKCWTAIVKEVRGRFGADAVEMADLQMSQSSTTERRVKGDGSYTMAKGGSSKFRFTCTHNVSSGDIYAVTVAPDDAQKQPVSGGNPVQEAIDGCQRGVASDLQTRTNTPNVHFLENRLQTASAEATGITGNGTFRVANGDWKKFSYECTFDHVNNKASAVRVTGP